MFAGVSATLRSICKIAAISRDWLTTRPLSGPPERSRSRSSRFSASNCERCDSTIATAALFASTASRLSSRWRNAPSRLSLSRSTYTRPIACEGKLQRHAHEGADAIECVVRERAEAAVRRDPAGEEWPAIGQPPRGRRVERAEDLACPVASQAMLRDHVEAPGMRGERHEPAVAARMLDRKLHHLREQPVHVGRAAKQLVRLLERAELITSR